MKIGDKATILKYKSSFAKGYTWNLSEEFFLIKKVKNNVCGKRFGKDRRKRLKSWKSNQEKMW